MEGQKRTMICRKCRGTGHITKTEDGRTVSVPCPQCGGKGFKPKYLTK